MDENGKKTAASCFKVFSATLAVALLISNTLWFLKARSDRLYYANGIEKINKKRLNEAIKDFEAALWQNPEDPSSHFGIAWAYQLRGQSQESIDHYAKAISLSQELLGYSFNNLQFLMQNLKNAPASDRIGKQRALLQQMKTLQ